MTNEQKLRIAEFRQQGMGYAVIANMLSLSKSTVISHCRRNQLAGKRADVSVPAKRFCKECGREIVQLPGRKTMIFCCAECRVRWWNSHISLVNKKAIYSFTCACCGKPFTVYGNAKRKYCSHQCYIFARYHGRGSHE